MSAFQQNDVTVACRSLSIVDEVQAASIPLWLLYPSHTPARPQRFGAYDYAVAPDGKPVGEQLPLVVFSHGTGSFPWVFRDLAGSLVRGGFVVALPVHPGNNRDDNSLAGTAAILAHRPRHLRLVIDTAFTDAQLGPRLTAGVAVIGHSLGGYTALASAGGRPVTLPHEEADGAARPVAVLADARVRALVLLAPAVPWFREPGSLADVTTPIMMRTGELDEHTPAVHAEIVKRGLAGSARLDHQVVANAGHFSFFSPFPAAMTRPEFPPSQDPPGFDRQAYQPTLQAEILGFLRAARA